MLGSGSRRWIQQQPMSGDAENSLHLALTNVNPVAPLPTSVMHALQPAIQIKITLYSTRPRQGWFAPTIGALFLASLTRANGLANHCVKNSRAKINIKLCCRRLLQALWVCSPTVRHDKCAGTVRSHPRFTFSFAVPVFIITLHVLAFFMFAPVLFKHCLCSCWSQSSVPCFLSSPDSGSASGRML